MNKVDHVCRITTIKPLTASTFEVELQAAATAVLQYRAGQYLALELDLNKDGQAQTLLYTIANAFDPERPQRLQLFIQNNSTFSAKVVDYLSKLSANNDKVKVTLSMGKAYLQTDLSLPHLLVAAGSGISKIKCLTEQILRQQPDATVSIYWSNKRADDFYLLDQFQTWVSQNNTLKFTPVLESASDDWPGRSGYLYRVIEQDFNHLEGTQAYLCGSPNMVYGTLEGLESVGLQKDNCYSDVFELSR